MKNKKVFFLAAFLFLAIAFSEKTYGQVTNVDNCSGSCVWGSTCPAGQTRSSNQSEYCANQDNICCIVTQDYTCTNTRGQSCYSTNCEDSGRDDGTGTCASGQYCCAGSFNYTCENTSGQSCNQANCEDAGLNDGSGTCASGQYCCAGSFNYTCENTSGQSCNQVNCEDANLDDGDGTCTSGQYCCKKRDSSSGGTVTTEWGDDDEDSGGSGTAWNPQSAGKFGLPSGTISGIIESLVAWLLGIFGFLGIITFVVAGIYYFTAAGDAEVEKKAKNAMKMGIFGIVVGLIGLVVIQAVDLLLNAGTTF